MAPVRSLSPDYHATGADLCTTGSKKHELNLSKATLCRRHFYAIALIEIEPGMLS
jgi:hypothetical protein